MRARAAPRRVRVEARAKLNLGLAVGPRRRDGYHDLATVFQSVSLSDTLFAVRAAHDFTLTVSHENAALRGKPPRARRRGVPAGRANLVLRAARLAAERLGIAGGARFRLVKRIPARAGLGGGSADAAAALVACATLHGVRLSKADRMALAAELGSDVPFAVLGGTALGLGRGERLRPLRLARPFRALIAVPGWRISTAAAFREFDRSKYGLTGWRRNLRFAESLGRKRVSASRALGQGNTFEGVLRDRTRDFESLCARLRVAGIAEPHLTGSGSAVFGVLGPGTPVRDVVARFAGGELLYLVRSARAGLRLRTLS